MKTWNEITSDKEFEPEFIELTISSDNGTEVVNAMIFNGIRVDYDSIPHGFHPYAIRHDDDWSDPSTVENNVLVNFFGTILVDHDLMIEDGGYLKITDWVFKDWQCVAVEELEARCLPTEYYEYWDNMVSIRENILNIDLIANSIK